MTEDSGGMFFGIKRTIIYEPEASDRKKRKKLQDIKDMN